MHESFLSTCPVGLAKDGAFAHGGAVIESWLQRTFNATEDRGGEDLVREGSNTAALHVNKLGVGAVLWRYPWSIQW